MADGSVILPDGIGTVAFIFCNKGSTEKIFLLGVRHCSKLNAKLIFLGMLDQKGLSYSSHGGTLEVCDGSVPVMFGHLTAYNLYKVDLVETTNLVTISYRAMTAGTSKSAADMSVWHRRSAHPNEAAIKQLAKITSGMTITPSSNILPFCSVCSHIETLDHTLLPLNSACMLTLEEEEMLMPHFEAFATLSFLFARQLVTFG